MKNIHIIPTDKPSRLYKDDNQVLNLNTHSVLKGIFTNGIGSNQHIYITSDEKIKDVRPHKGKWQLEKGQILNKFPTYLTDLSECKLVIMTTDQDLINDGVQAIDDKFLEWFVKNPSCEKVEIESWQTKGEWDLDYKIIIPKEEPLIEFTLIEKELIEEAKKLWQESHPNPIEMALFGTKWQQERMYSEAIEFAEWIRIKDFQTASKDNWIGLDMKYYTTEELFEQFKKK